MPFSALHTDHSHIAFHFACPRTSSSGARRRRRRRDGVPSSNLRPSGSRNLTEEDVRGGRDGGAGAGGAGVSVGQGIGSLALGEDAVGALETPKSPEIGRAHV